MVCLGWGFSGKINFLIYNPSILSIKATAFILYTATAVIVLGDISVIKHKLLRKSIFLIFNPTKILRHSIESRESLLYRHKLILSQCVTHWESIFKFIFFYLTIYQGSSQTEWDGVNLLRPHKFSNLHFIESYKFMGDFSPLNSWKMKYFSKYNNQKRKKERFLIIK